MTYLERTSQAYLKEKGIHPDKGKAHKMTYWQLKEMLEDFQTVKWILKRTRTPHLFPDDSHNHNEWWRTQKS